MSEPYHATMLRNDKHLVDVADVYCLRPDRRWPWLQRILFWVLRKLRAHSQQWEGTVSVIDLRLARFHRFFRAYLNEIYRQTGDTPKRVLIGWKTMEQFVASDEWRDLMCYPQTFNMPLDIPYWRGEYLGITLLTLPWFEEGLIFLPNDL